MRTLKTPCKYLIYMGFKYYRAACRTRTNDPLITSQKLYQLS